MTAAAKDWYAKNINRMSESRSAGCEVEVDEEDDKDEMR
jgi:hypothetical protein